ncbi:MAG: PAS domain S-box protein [Candidatus Odinarchaeota archaeon]
MRMTTNSEAREEKIKILHVDDEEPFLTLSQKFLSKLNPKLDITSVSDPHQILQLIETNDYDLVVCDYQMPDKDGLELLEEMRKSENRIPFIILTGRGREEIAIKALNLGADFYLQKGSDAKTLFTELNHFIMHAIERYKAREELKTSETRYRELFNAISSGVAVYEALDGAKDFIFKDLNRSGERMDRVNREDIIGRAVTECFPGVEDFGLFEIMQRVWKTGEPEVHPLSFYTDQRIQGWRSNHIYQLPSGEIVSVYDDITDQKRAEEALRVNEQRLRNLFDTMTEGVVLITPDGKITEANHSACDILGLTKSEVENRSYIAPEWDIIHTDGTPMPLEEMAGPRAMAERHPVKNVVMGVRRPDDRVSWINVNAAPIINDADKLEGVVGTFTDITEWKEAEKALVESEEKFSLFMDNLPALVSITELDGRTIYANKRIKKALSIKELSRKPAIEILPPEMAKMVVARNEQVLVKGAQTYETTGFEKDGIKSIFETVKFPIMREGRSPLIGNIAINVTERKKSEQALQESEAHYRRLFEESPVPLYEEDLSGIKLFFDDLRKSGIENFREYFDNHPETVKRCATFGKVLDLNNAALKMLGIENKENLLGSLDKGFSKDVYPAFKEELIALAEGKTDFTFETVPLRIKEKNIFYHLRLFVLPGHEQTLSKILVSTLDITEIKKKEEELKENEERFRSIYETSPVGIEFYDSSGHLVDANKACLDIFGVDTLDDVCGFSLFEDPNLSDDVINKLKKGETVKYEIKFDFDKVRELKLYETAKSGKINLEVQIKPLKVSEKQSYLVHVREISEK